MSEFSRHTDDVFCAAIGAQTDFDRAYDYAEKVLIDVPDTYIGYGELFDMHLFEYFLRIQPATPELLATIAGFKQDMEAVIERAGLPDELCEEDVSDEVRVVKKRALARIVEKLRKTE